MAQRIDQLLAGYADGDAISQEARILQSALQSLGYESEIYAPRETTSPAIADQCRPLNEYANGTRSSVIFHYSIASEASALFATSNCQRIVRYHNITPAHFLDGFDDVVADQLRSARAQLKAIASQCDEVWADSDFNAREVRELGITKVKSVPLFFHPSSIDIPPDPETLRSLSGGIDNILFVGRLAPNKCIEDLITAFGWYQNAINPNSRLTLVGSEWSCPRYFAMLLALTERLALSNVTFSGFVNDAELSAYYETASVFVCPSRHEGYCLPLIEAMCHHVPVIARHNGGMPEALGNSGMLFQSDDPKELAVLINTMIRNTEQRQHVLTAQAKRLQILKSRDIPAECRELLG